MFSRQQQSQHKSLEATLDRHVRVFEKKIVIDVAAEMYAGFAHKGGIRFQDLDGMLTAPSQTVFKLFCKYDTDNSGMIDPKELLAIVRHLNFSRGFCDSCFASVGGNERACICESCGDYMLCESCYADRALVHPQHKDFVSLSDFNDARAKQSGLPRDVGEFLRGRIQALFDEFDDNGDGEISIEELRCYCIANGSDLSFVEFVLAFDLDGNGCISPSEALYMLMALEMTRVCDECNEISFITDGDIVSCAECTEEYDICQDCWNAGRCSHRHDQFEVATPFQLRSVGLYYEHAYGNKWRITVGNEELWHKYEPFIGDKINSVVELGKPGSSSADIAIHAAREVATDIAKEALRDAVNDAVVDAGGWEDAVMDVLEAAGEVFSWFF